MTNKADIPTRVLRLFQQLAHAAYRADKLIHCRCSEIAG
jgi:hypothetical protein